MLQADGLHAPGGVDGGIAGGKVAAGGPTALLLVLLLRKRMPRRERRVAGARLGKRVQEAGATWQLLLAEPGVPRQRGARAHLRSRLRAVRRLRGPPAGAVPPARLPLAAAALLALLQRQQELGGDACKVLLLLLRKVLLLLLLLLQVLLQRGGLLAAQLRSGLLRGGRLRGGDAGREGRELVLRGKAPVLLLLRVERLQDGLQARQARLRTEAGLSNHWRSGMCVACLDKDHRHAWLLSGIGRVLNSQQAQA